MYEEHDAVKPRPWTERERALIDWYGKVRDGGRLPADAFGLTHFENVVGPELFYAILDHEAAHDQARTLRALRGGFIYDLEGLHICVEGKEFAHGAVQNLFEDGPASNSEEEAPKEVCTVPLLFE